MRDEAVTRDGQDVTLSVGVAEAYRLPKTIRAPGRNARHGGQSGMHALNHHLLEDW